MFSDPVKIIDEAQILPGMDIADLGAGSGAYTFAAGRALLSSGRVYAVDVQKDLLTKLKNAAVKAGLYNIEVIWGDLEKLNGTGLRDTSIDLVLLTNIMFQVEERSTLVKEAKRILRPAGRVMLVDWIDASGGVGPKKEMIFSKNEAKKLFEKNGFHTDKEFDAGSHHYGIIFKKL